MILYKNVDIKDLESILSKGILSLNESGNDNWDEGKRADNSRDVVYLFKPLTKNNSLNNYGAALLEVDIKENQFVKNEGSNGKYVEYTTDRVPAKDIVAIYIPELFKEYISLPDDVMAKITWCGIKAKHYGDRGKEDCPADVLKQFAKTAEIMDAGCFNFFRGLTEERTMIDLYDIQYIY